jgi:hypothetical protein
MKEENIFKKILLVEKKRPIPETLKDTMTALLEDVRAIQMELEIIKYQTELAILEQRKIISSEYFLKNILNLNDEN